MTRSAVLASVRRLRGLLAVPHEQQQSDEQLLAAFANRRDDLAFATLVRRHGPMVLGVCRRVLGHEQDAEDAFQATFLVLARQATALRDKTALASFLYGTAYHLASKAKRAAGRRRKHEGSLGVRTQPRSPVSPTDELSWREARALVDQEIANLPEKYRSVFVLCCLESVGQAEAARRLGLKEGTLSSRLTTARKRLAKRLARRGVDLSVVLAAAALAPSLASALPIVPLPHLAGGTVSPTVAALTESFSPLLGLGKAKIAAGIVLAAMLVSAAGWFVEPGERHGVSSPVQSPTGGLTPRRSPGASKAREIRGRVLDLDGKPVKNACLSWHRYRKELPKEESRLELTERGRSDDEGRFRIVMSDGEDLHDSLRQLVVTAAGYGLAWVELPKAKANEEVTVRLGKDVAIRGRIVSTEGRPLAGVRVRVDHLEELPNARLDEYLAFWEQDWRKAVAIKSRWLALPSRQAVLPEVRTDADGRFQIFGVGSERIVHLQLRGDGIAHASPWIVARSGFDPSALNKAVRERVSMLEPRIPGQPPILYGPSFEFVASPSRIVEGVVREAGSGKLVPGVRIHGSAGYGFDSQAITDQEGRYRLEGLPKVKHYHLLHAMPPWDSPWLPAQQSKDAEDGLPPVRVDFTLGRGVALTGRVIDRITGKGVDCSITYDYLPDNKFVDKPEFNVPVGGYRSEEDGRFRIKVAPGTGVLKAAASAGKAANPFKPGRFTDEERKQTQFTPDGELVTFGGAVGFFKLQNAVKRMDLAPDAGVVEQDLYLERGAAVKVRIFDPRNKPLTGVVVSGIDALPGHHYQEPYVAAESECTLVALDPPHPRQVVFYHAQRRLAASLMVRGDEKEPLTMRLAPTGTVIGRVTQEDGPPLAGAEIEVWSNGPSAPPNLSYLYLSLNHKSLTPRTDKEGRFRLEGIVPDGPFVVDIRRRGAYLDGGSRTRNLEVKAGQTLDLGDLVIKARP